MNDDFTSLLKKITDHYSLMNYSKYTIFRHTCAFREYITVNNITVFKELENLELLKKYIVYLKEKKLKQRTIQFKIESMSVIIEFFIVIQEFESTPYRFKKNIFKYILKTNKFVNDLESYRVRSIEDIEVFIQLINDLEYKVIFLFYSSGFRKHEILCLSRKQIDLEKKVLYNILRKGKRLHKKVGIPEYIMPYLKQYLQYHDNMIVFDKTIDQVTYFNRQHFERLQLIFTKLLHKEDLSEYWKNIRNKLEILLKNGKITPHQLRATWDTISVKNGMKDVYRRYHLNHTLPGMDNVYVQVDNSEETFRDYIFELNTKGPKYII